MVHILDYIIKKKWIYITVSNFSTDQKEYNSQLGLQVEDNSNPKRKESVATMILVNQLRWKIDI